MIQEDFGTSDFKWSENAKANSMIVRHKGKVLPHDNALKDVSITFNDPLTIEQEECSFTFKVEVGMSHHILYQ